MWADITMTKPQQQQGTAFRVMCAELMNCPVKYKDPEDSEDKRMVKQPISAGKMLTWWKSEVAAPAPFSISALGKKGF